MNLKTNHSVLTFSLLALVTVIGCNNQPQNKTEVVQFNKIDSLRSTFLGIEDSLLHTWNVMINDDNKKIKALTRLVQEIVYAGGEDSVMTKDLIVQISNLKSKRYSRKTMADSQLIDYYDSISNDLVNQAITLAIAHDEFERNIVMNEMIDEINQSEGKILFYRVDYDEITKTYNSFIKQHQSIMDEIDNDHTKIQLPIFELPADQ
jgi:hypothetical protein